MSEAIPEMTPPGSSSSSSVVSQAINSPAQIAVDLNALLLPGEWSLQQLEAEARRIFFEDLARNPPVTPPYKWLESRKLIVSATDGAFRHIFGESEGWASYHHRKTGALDRDRLRRVNWIRPILEMRVPKTKIYVNNHSMKAREFGPKARQEKKRIFVTLGKDVSYFISLVYTDNALALATAFPPDGRWLREKIADATFIGPA